MQKEKRNIIEVSKDFYNFLENKVIEIETELVAVQKESRAYCENGHRTNPEKALEEQLQKSLKQAKACLRRCFPISKPADNLTVGIGSVVTLLINSNKEKIVRLEGMGGYLDACSLESPIGSKIFGAKKGDTFTVKKNVFEIIKIAI
jgi:transcription elongation GreA/GreB family factor